jgi:hypothetical protein
MSDEKRIGVPWSFWVLGAVALIWNVLGGMNFIMQMNADALVAMPPSHRAIVEGRPLWATIGFAIAVFGGALGCLLLLLRRQAASYLFIASLLGVIAQLIHTLRIAAATNGFTPLDFVLIVLMPPIVAAFLIWYARQAQRKGGIA